MAIAGLVCLVLSYIVATDPGSSRAAMWLSLAPFGAVIVAIIWKSRFRVFNFILFLAVVVAGVVNTDTLYAHIIWLYFLQHIGAMVVLAAVFGSTLRGSHAQALCSRVAAMIIPVELDADYLRYTWQVTLAWTAYFVICAVLSVILFFFAPIEAWSVFGIIITPVSTGLMFVAEYLMRRQVLPNGPKISIATIVQAYKKGNW